jgi:hypothetical protein
VAPTQLLAHLAKPVRSRDRPVFIDGDEMVEAFAAGLSSEPALVS